MFSEDLAAFFDTANGFAQNATLAGGGVVPVIFDRAYVGVLSGLVESTGPQATAKSADVAAVVQGSTLAIGGTTYTVTGVEPDGTGVTTLQLRG
jgi:hypothetical protein